MHVNFAAISAHAAGVEKLLVALLALWRMDVISMLGSDETIQKVLSPLFERNWLDAAKHREKYPAYTENLNCRCSSQLLLVLPL